MGAQWSMPPQLRWFMRTTFMPAAKPLRAIPSMYCDSLDPSSPCTTISVSALSGLSASDSGTAPESPGSTSIRRRSAAGRSIRRGRKNAASVCTCPPRSPALRPEDRGRKRRRLLRQAVLEAQLLTGRLRRHGLRSRSSSLRSSRKLILIGSSQFHGSDRHADF